MKHRIVLLIAVLITGCTFGIEKSVRVGTIPETDIAELPKLYGTNVTVWKFFDERQNSNLGVVDGETLTYDGELGFLVKEGVESAFRKAGADVRSFGSPRVEGTVESLDITTEQQFGVFTAKATAKITARVIAADGKTSVYSGKYTGASERKTPYLSSGQLESMIGEALKLAVTEVVADASLADRLRK